MLTEVNSAMCDAMETNLTHIESSYVRGYAGMQLIGNASEVCRDGKERAKAALEALGLPLPAKRLVVSIAPADIKKDGNQFDLPFAASLALLVRKKIPVIDTSKWLFAAELGLSGELKPVRGVVSFAVAAVAEGLEGLVVAKENLEELSAIASLEIPHLKNLKALGFHSLKSVLTWIFKGDLSGAYSIRKRFPSSTSSIDNIPNFDDMILDSQMQSAALVVATGLHSLLLRGSPGTGKSMFAARMPSILPPMEKTEHIEALRIQSSHREKIPQSLLAGRPPFRSPHHQASPQAVLGGHDRPGELALAHGGILFLDEFPEFRRDLLEALREPLETGEIRLSRVKKKVTWKSRIILIAACNNCPCGWHASKRRKCDCNQQRLFAYWHKLSGPILDRIDIHINVPEPTTDSADIFLRLAKDKENSSSKTKEMAERVKAARKFAKKRNKKFGVEFNRDLNANNLLAASGLSEHNFTALINKFAPKTSSNRAIIHAIRVARTLSDIDESPTIREQDFEQAWNWQAEMSAQDRGEDIYGV